MSVRRPFTLEHHNFNRSKPIFTKIGRWPPFMILNKFASWPLTSEVTEVKLEVKNTKINFNLPYSNLLCKTCGWFWASQYPYFWPLRSLEVRIGGQSTKIDLPQIQLNLLNFFLLRSISWYLAMANFDKLTLWPLTSEVREIKNTKINYSLPGSGDS